MKYSEWFKQNKNALEDLKKNFENESKVKMSLRTFSRFMFNETTHGKNSVVGCSQCNEKCLPDHEKCADCTLLDTREETARDIIELFSKVQYEEELEVAITERLAEHETYIERIEKGNAKKQSVLSVTVPFGRVDGGYLLDYFIKHFGGKSVTIRTEVDE